ncbi:GNAT family N-acetyltransferase [Methylovulum psychrotolerans]|jgi:RimJ/RimL family protein N-acetyltransferase|uniref:N-acetyltransferase n=1 Tax=Methylovulum psychrotolerans TaxID=1704499 RepID=A0A2S5CI78_9GAMM|nr:GNAT family N-acetyltransferase [Methylovulum psychrotolerans]MBT9097372.1 GNAT family N-acetyltransferase [Methylovulum psychrotolerans]POZ50520.1 N-acetyltransferase [Methylovulum psychrotolerans]
MKKPSDFDFKPSIVGGSIVLRPLYPEDFGQLYAVAADPLIWEQHPQPLRYQREVFGSGFFAGAIASPGALVVLDKLSGDIIGSSRFYEWDAERQEVAIGFTFLARSHWGGQTNRELKRLMLEHAFRWANTVWFHVGVNNIRSRKAMEKIGAEFSHETAKTVNGVMDTYAFYRIEAIRFCTER